MVAARRPRLDPTPEDLELAMRRPANVPIMNHRHTAFMATRGSKVPHGRAPCRRLRQPPTVYCWWEEWLSTALTVPATLAPIVVLVQMVLRHG